MPKHTIEILSTKILGKSLIYFAALNNILIDEISFIETKPVEEYIIKENIAQLQDADAAIVFTSVNALHAVRNIIIPNKHFCKIFCIGNKTKKLAVSIFGEECISGCADNASALAKKIIDDALIKKVIFFCGDQRRDELPAELKKNKIEVSEIVVYTTIETPIDIHKKFDGILFFSPSGVKSFFKKNIIDSDVQIFSIGETTASEVKHFTTQPVIIAEKPGTEELINLAVKYFSKNKIA